MEIKDARLEETNHIKRISSFSAGLRVKSMVETIVGAPQSLWRFVNVGHVVFSSFSCISSFKAAKPRNTEVQHANQSECLIIVTSPDIDIA